MTPITTALLRPLCRYSIRAPAAGSTRLVSPSGALGTTLATGSGGNPTGEARRELSSRGRSGLSDSRLLRRPAGYKRGGQANRSPQSARDPNKWRSNVVALFPGDFRDRESMWDDDDDEAFQDKETAFLDDDGSQQLLEEDLVQRALDEEIARHKAQKEKWIENSKPPVRKSVIDGRGRAYGKGGRKRAKATVFIQPGTGQIVVNRQDYIDYFQRSSDRDHLLLPMVITDTMGYWDVQASVKGGGLTGQAGAIRLGIANALNAYNPDLYRPPLKHKGLLTRDSRIVEEKKYGLLKARKAPQWVRR